MSRHDLDSTGAIRVADVLTRVHGRGGKRPRRHASPAVSVALLWAAYIAGCALMIVTVAVLATWLVTG